MVLEVVHGFVGGLEEAVRLGFQRQIWGYDTFQGMTAPHPNDVKPGFKVDAAAYRLIEATARIWPVWAA